MTMITNADDPVTFDTEVLHADRPVVVEFWAPWCGPCRLVAPELEKLADSQADAVKMVKVNVDASAGLALAYDVQSVPTVALFYEGKVVARSIGAKPRSAIEADLGLTPYRAA